MLARRRKSSWLPVSTTICSSTRSSSCPFGFSVRTKCFFRRIRMFPAPKTSSYRRRFFLMGCSPGKSPFTMFAGMLLPPQRPHRIDPRRATRGNKSGRDRHHRKQAQQHLVEQREDRCVRADPEGQGHNHHRAEDRIAEQTAHGITEIAHESPFVLRRARQAKVSHFSHLGPVLCWFCAPELGSYHTHAERRCLGGRHGKPALPAHQDHQ